MDNLIVLIAHAPLASALRQCAAHVFPEREADVVALDIAADDPPAHSLERARQAVAGRGDAGLLVLSDILGATPCNVARQLLQGLPQRPGRLLAGANLPMLLRAITYQHEPLDQLAARVLAGGQQGVLQVGTASS